MTFYTLCVNAETGRYLAVSTQDISIQAFGDSEDAALGAAIRMGISDNSGGIMVEKVEHIETSRTYPPLPRTAEEAA